MIAPAVDPQPATGAAPLVPDLEAASAFLDAWVSLTGAQHVTLVRIIPDKDDCKGRAFHWPNHRDDALRWIAASSRCRA